MTDEELVDFMTSPTGQRIVRDASKRRFSHLVRPLLRSPGGSKMDLNLVRALREGAEEFHVSVRLGHPVSRREEILLGNLGVVVRSYADTIVTAQVTADQLRAVVDMDVVISVEGSQTLRPV